MNNEWVSGPLLNTERFDHSCGVMNVYNYQTRTTEKFVVVAGGRKNSDNYLSSVELLNLNDYETSQQSWTFGPSLPKVITAARMTEFQDGVLLVAGTGGSDVDGRHLFQLSSPNGPWTEMKQTLREGRYHAVSFFIPDEIANCH